MLAPPTCMLPEVQGWPYLGRYHMHNRFTSSLCTNEPWCCLWQPSLPWGRPRSTGPRDTWALDPVTLLAFLSRYLSELMLNVTQFNPE